MSHDMQQSRNTEISNCYVFVEDAYSSLSHEKKKKTTIFKELVGQLSELCISNCMISLLSLHAYTSHKHSNAPIRMA